MMTEDFREGDLYRPASVLNLSGQHLTRLENIDGTSVTTLIADRNGLSRIENLDHMDRLRQLSLASNEISRMSGVAQLANLTVLNLPNNQIAAVEGTRGLVNLTWLNLSGNLIRSMEHLDRNVNLKHLDLSDNHVAAIANIANLRSLKTLLLHGNRITNLRLAAQCLPAGVSILSLAENLIEDLTEVSFLTGLGKLEQLSIMNNPCVIAPTDDLDFDYRPYVINWCLKLRILDGCLVTEKESLRAEWLYSQGKGRCFKPGQHISLVFYLNQNCPLSSIEDPRDQKLALILSKQRYHQSQLQRSNPAASLSQARPLRPQSSPADDADCDAEPMKAWSGAESPALKQPSPRAHRLGARFPAAAAEETKENVRPRDSVSPALPSPPTRGPYLSAVRRSSNLASSSSVLHRAAVRIQACWRGYRVRCLHPRVRVFRAEQERARVREHVSFLQLQLDSYYQAYAQERQLRSLQTEAIKGLMREVADLKAWRSRVEATPPPLTAGATLLNLPSLVSAMTQQLAGADRVSVLESHLSDLSRSLTELKATLRLARSHTAEVTLASVARPGCPLAPRGLHVAGRGADWLEVAWRPSPVVLADGSCTPDGVVGYRVFVNGLETAMVYDSKTSVLLSGLDLAQPVSVAVRCLSHVGESYFSDTLDVVAERAEAESRGESRQSELSADDDTSESADRERVYEEARKVMEMSTSYESERSQATVTEATRLSQESDSEEDRLGKETEEEEKERDESAEDSTQP